MILKINIHIFKYVCFSPLHGHQQHVIFCQFILGQTLRSFQILSFFYFEYQCFHYRFLLSVRFIAIQNSAANRKSFQIPVVSNIHVQARKYKLVLNQNLWILKLSILANEAMCHLGKWVRFVRMWLKEDVKGQQLKTDSNSSKFSALAFI